MEASEALKKLTDSIGRAQAGAIDLYSSVKKTVSDNKVWSAKSQSTLNSKKEHALFQASTVNKEIYTSFSGTDAKVSLSFKFGQPVAIGEAQTVTYSIYRPMVPVYNLGSPKPAGFVRGPRTIAGSIIFTVFDRNVLIAAMHKAYSQYDVKCLNKSMLTDELPPFDIQITFLNEYGQSALLAIHDVHITSEGQVSSIEDMITENTVQYIASDITVMQPDVYENK